MEHPIIHTEPAFNVKADRIRMMEIMMETFNIPAYYSAQQAATVFYSAGAITGKQVHRFFKNFYFKT